MTYGGVTYAGRIQLRNLAIAPGTSKTLNPSSSSSPRRQGARRDEGVGCPCEAGQQLLGLVWQRLQAQHDDGFAAHQPDDHVPDRLVRAVRDPAAGRRGGLAHHRHPGLRAQLSPPDATSPQVALVDPATSPRSPRSPAPSASRSAAGTPRRPSRVRRPRRRAPASQRSTTSPLTKPPPRPTRSSPAPPEPRTSRRRTS